MAKIHGVAGEWARVKGVVSGLWPLFAGVFSAGFVLGLAFRYPLAGATLFVLSVLGCVYALTKGLRHVERYFKGARGEERIASILRSLPEGYHIFNDFVANGGHVDHVVVGPAGVFAVETKNWTGEVTIEDGHILVDGRLPDREPLKQALKEAAAVRDELGKLGWTGTVTPVLAFASDTFKAKAAELSGAVVINGNQLKESFSTGRTVLESAELDRLVMIMSSAR